MSYSVYWKGSVALSAFLLLFRGILLLPPMNNGLVTLTDDFCIADPETLLACGETISFEEADLYTLELIPGLGQKVFWNTYMYQREIQSHYCLTEDAIGALSIVPSIGEKTAQKILRYVNFENLSC